MKKAKKESKRDLKLKMASVEKLELDNLLEDVPQINAQSKHLNRIA